MQCKTDPGCTRIECELTGCQRYAAAPPLAPEASLSWLERKAVALHNRLESLARKPAAPVEEEPYLLTDEDRVSDILTLMPQPDTQLAIPAPVAVPPIPMPPKAIHPLPRPAREIKTVSTPNGGYGHIENNALVAVALDPEGAGRALTTLLQQ